MHMADALLSPAVGGALWAASGAALTYSARRVNDRDDDRTIPLMGVLGAFVFAAQMINFSIPGTGSSGHLGGGLLLSILLGPHAALIAIASVLTVQALFFADGGLLALGANVFNLGVIPCYLAYPLVYRSIAGTGGSEARTVAASIAAAVVGLQCGALGVVLQTVGSGVTSLQFTTFALLMQPIHLAIGLVEGLATAAILLFIRRARPDLLTRPAGVGSTAVLRPFIIAFAATAAVTAGVLSWFASTQPDGLEWSIERAGGGQELAAPEQGVHAWLAAAQHRLALFPDYDVATAVQTSSEAAGRDRSQAGFGTSAAGIVGGLVTLVLVWAVGLLLRRRHRR